MNPIVQYVGAGVLAATVSLHAGGLYFHHTLRLNDTVAYRSILPNSEAALHTESESGGALISQVAMDARGINWL